jgi:hypothetical protein
VSPEAVGAAAIREWPSAAPVAGLIKDHDYKLLSHTCH